MRQNGGYLLRVADDVVDLMMFRRLVEAARATSGAEALEGYLRGIALWQGRCGDGLDLGPQAQALFTAVDLEYVEAVIDAADLAIGLGQASQVVR